MIRYRCFSGASRSLFGSLFGSHSPSLLLVLAAFLFPCATWAQILCTSSNLRFPAITLPTDKLASTPINSVFYTFTHTFTPPPPAVGSPYVVICDLKMSGAYNWWYVDGTRRAPGAPDGVYTTTMTNVGIKVTWIKMMPYGEFAQSIRISENNVLFVLRDFSWPIKLEFYKLGENISGSLQGTLLSARFSGDTTTINEAMKLSFSTPIVVTPPQPVTPTCRPLNNLIQLRDVRVTEFNGVGSTAGERDFPINLACRGGNMGAYVEMTDVTTPGNTSSVLTLAQGSTAAGVGIQLLDTDGFPFPLRQKHYVGQVQASQNWRPFDISLRVRYIQVQPQISAGNSVKGKINFTLSYQ